MHSSTAHTVVILTALPLECDEVRRHLIESRVVYHSAGTIFFEGELPSVPGRIVLGLTGKGNMAATLCAERAIATYRPVAVLGVGVAGRLRDDVDLGDIIVGTKIYALHGGREEAGGLRPRTESWNAPHELEQVAHQVRQAGTWTPFLPEGRSTPRVHFTAIAAGDIVLDTKESRQARFLRENYSDASAIDMESAGLAKAGEKNRRLPVLTIRAISDRADGRKAVTDAEGWQPIAAANAAAFAVGLAGEFLESYPASEPTRLPRPLRALVSWLDRRRRRPLASRDADARLAGLVRTLIKIERRRLDDEVMVRGLAQPQPLRVEWSPVNELSPDPADIFNDNMLRGSRMRRRGDTFDLVPAFRELPRRQLVLLGEPGAGKSTAALLLAHGLLNPPKPGEPVPVLVPLSSWNPRAEHLQAWLARRLAEQYRSLTPDLAWRLILTGRLLPILDGLDELTPALHPEAIEGIDRAAAGRPMVVTCRTSEYAAAVRAGGTVFATAAVFALQPVGFGDATRFLASSAPARSRWQPVFEHVRTHPGEPLAGVLANPLMVSLARTVHRDPVNDPAELLRCRTREVVERRLLDSYVPAVYARHPPLPGSAPSRAFDCTPDQARRWLSFLAAYLERRGQLDLAWWRVPEALPRMGLASAVGAVNWLIIALTIGLVFGVINTPVSGVVFALTVGGSVGLATGVAVGQTAGWAVERPRMLKVRMQPAAFARGALFGLPVGVLGALTFAIRSYRSGIPHVLMAGGVLVVLATVLFGLFFGLGPPHDEKQPVGPMELLRTDRATRWLIGLTAAVLFGLTSGYVLGPVFGVAGGLAAGLGCVLNGTYGRYTYVRLLLAARGRVPLRLMGFLADAHRRGVLRQAGAVYQFRHSRLQHGLATDQR